MPKIKPEELKASILQYAIEGRLVEQRAEEGTADEQFDIIQKEITKLVKEKRIGKPKKMAPIEEISAPYDIPENWKWVRLGMVCNEILVPQRDKPKHFDGDIPWCRIEDIEGKYLNGTKSNQYVSKETVESMNLKVNPIGTVISANSASVGAAAICSVECITNQTFIGLVCNKGLYNEYLYYFLKANASMLKKMGAGTTILYISQDKYWNLPFPLPPLAEQRRIVAKIEELLPYVDRYAEAYEKLEEFNAKFPDEMKKSILQYAIEGRLVEQRAEEGTAEELYKQIRAEKQKLIKEGKIKKEKPLPEITEDEIPFDIPESWKWVRLGSIFTLQAGKNITSSDIVDNEDDEHKYLCYGGNGIRGYVKTYNRSGYYVIIGRQGALCGCVNYANGDFYATEHAVVVDHYDITDTKWGGLFLEALNLNQYATATAQPGLSVANINQVLIPLPPLAEQRRIVARIEELLPLCERLAECREKA